MPQVSRLFDPHSRGFRERNSAEGSESSPLFQEGNRTRHGIFCVCPSSNGGALNLFQSLRDKAKHRSVRRYSNGVSFVENYWSTLLLFGLSIYSEYLAFHQIGQQPPRTASNTTKITVSIKQIKQQQQQQQQQQHRRLTS